MNDTRTAAAPGPLDSEYGRDARALLETAAAQLGDVPPAFASLLFGHTAPEDLLGYDAGELAHLTRESWAFLSVRKPGEAKLRFVAPPAAAGDRLKSVGVIEVVNDDMPFLVDSLMGELNDRGLNVRLLAHPLLTVERDAAGKLTATPAAARSGTKGARESLIHIHVDRIEHDGRRAEVAQALDRALGDVRLAVQDWKPMLARIEDAIAQLKANPPPVPVQDIAEAIQFLEWLVAGNFTLLGVQDYNLSGSDLEPVAESALGLLRRPNFPVVQRRGKVVTISDEVLAFFNEPKTLIVTKANARSTVHRRVHLDYIGVKRFGADGAACGEFRIIGLFTSGAYTRPAHTIPYIRRKVDAVVTRAGFDPGGHSGKALANVLETYPRDELFQVDEDTLYRNALAIMQIEERPRVRVLARRDRFDRFVSVLTYIPRERFDTRVRQAIGKYLSQVYKGSISAFYPYFPDGPLVRVHFIVRREGGEPERSDRETLEEAVSAIVRTWTDSLSDALQDAFAPARAGALF